MNRLLRVQEREKSDRLLPWATAVLAVALIGGSRGGVSAADGPTATLGGGGR
jgi:hypothetical protein